jgi:hypothetical protein
MFEELQEQGAKIFIVTNASYGWIKGCLTNLLPDLNEYIIQNDIKVHSAASKEIHKAKWKVRV